MTDPRFGEGEPRLAKDEPRIADGDAPDRPAGTAGVDGPAAGGDLAPGIDPVVETGPGPELDEGTPPEDGTIAKPTHFTAVREAKGWSVNEVAGRLRMQVRQIEAIEAGRWGDLPGTAFVRAAIRSYARLLGRDPAPLLATVAKLDTGADLRPSSRAPVAISPTSSFDESSGIGRWGLALLGLLAVIAIAVYFAPSTDLRWPSQWFEGEGAPSAGAGPTASPAPAPAGAVPGAGRDGAPSAGSPSDEAVAAAARAANELLASQAGRRDAGTGGVSPSAGAAQGASASGVAVQSGAADGGTGAPAAEAPASADDASRADTGGAPARADGAPGSDSAVPTGAAADADQAAQGAATAADASPSQAVPSPASSEEVPASSLVMIFDAECWVEVTDAQGRRIVYGLQKPRTSLSLDVPGPVSVLVGNADAVTLTRGGEPVDVRSMARDGVAKLRLQ